MPDQLGIYNQNDRQRVIQLYKSGALRREITAQTGISASTLYKWLKGTEREVQPTTSRKRKSKINLNQARRMLKYGRTYKEIGDHFGVSESAVCHHFRKYGPGL